MNINVIVNRKGNIAAWAANIGRRKKVLKMKVLLVNGSPHQNGCTYTALCEVSESLNQNGIDTDVFWIGNKRVLKIIGVYFMIP